MANKLEPSKIIEHSETTLTIDGIPIHLDLVSMKRSFLLTINNDNFTNDQAPLVEQIVRGFTSSNASLKGLSLAIGEHNTCIINSENSLASATLATRLSKKLNKNRPVYVANNFSPPHDQLDASGFASKLYLKIFQFVRHKYNSDADMSI